jgi:hypothetical protein
MARLHGRELVAMARRYRSASTARQRRRSRRLDAAVMRRLGARSVVLIGGAQ